MSARVSVDAEAFSDLDRLASECDGEYWAELVTSLDPHPLPPALNATEAERVACWRAAASGWLNNDPNASEIPSDIARYLLSACALLAALGVADDDAGGEE